jgi:hypothetical protein
MTLAIEHRVGNGGVNDPPDVKIVRQLLNGHLAGIKDKLPTVAGAQDGGRHRGSSGKGRRLCQSGPRRMGIGYGMPKIVGAFELGLDAPRTGN